MLEVNSRSFPPKNEFLRLISHIDLLMALKIVSILVIIARHVPWANLLCLGVRKRHRVKISRHYRKQNEQ